VVGYEFLRHFRLTVDYRSQVLTLAEGQVAGREGRAAPRAEIPLRLAHPAKPLIVVPATVAGTGPHPFALDTGASVCVIARPLATRLGIRTKVIPALTGGGGAIPSSSGLVPSLAVEAARVTNLSVADFLEALSQALGSELLGIVGHNYLREFLVMVDYPSGVLRLE